MSIRSYAVSGGVVVALALAVTTGVGSATAAPAGLQAASTTGKVYVIQGVAGATAKISVDGSMVASAAAAKTIWGPLSLKSGSHSIVFDGGSAAKVSSTFNVVAGTSTDVVVHRQVNPTAAPVVTVYANDLSPIAHGSARLVVAHTAAVGPADVRVDKKVLFANIANGEALKLTVPAKTYSVDIVPTATSGPSVLGPVDLPVKADALNRVFAIGVAATGTMDAIVQVVPVGVRGSGAAPGLVNAGTGGQAQALIDASQDHGTPVGPAVGAIAVLLIGGLVLARRRTSLS